MNHYGRLLCLEHSWPSCDQFNHIPAFFLSFWTTCSALATTSSAFASSVRRADTIFAFVVVAFLIALFFALLRAGVFFAIRFFDDFFANFFAMTDSLISDLTDKWPLLDSKYRQN